MKELGIDMLRVAKFCGVVSFTLVLFAAAAAPSAEPNIPNFWDHRERISLPRVEGMPRLRFLTTIDFPPFNHLDAEGRLMGFHVDLATAICQELDLIDRCQIQALPWLELENALAEGGGEAIIAGLAITAESRSRLSFTRPYLKLPARFVVPVDRDLEEAADTRLAGRRVGVLAGSAHESMLRAYFPSVRPVTYDRSNWMYSDLRQGKLAALFGDGLQLSFWLGSVTAGNCCRFAGGPYLSDDYYGLGLAIAARRDQPALTDALNYALREIQTKGKFAEIYLRYFPINFY